jgi:hypothetical protein
MLAHVVDGEDVRVVEPARRARLLLEAPEAVLVLREGCRQNLHGHLAPDTGVAGAVDLPHPSRAERGHHLVGPRRAPGRFIGTPQRRLAAEPGIGRRRAPDSSAVLARRQAIHAIQALCPAWRLRDLHSFCTERRSGTSERGEQVAIEPVGEQPDVPEHREPPMLLARAHDGLTWRRPQRHGRRTAVTGRGAPGCPRRRGR